MANQVTPAGTQPYAAGGIGFGGGMFGSGLFGSPATNPGNVPYKTPQGVADTQQATALGSQFGPAFDKYFQTQIANGNSDAYKQLLAMIGSTGDPSSKSVDTPEELIAGKRNALQTQIAGGAQMGDLARQMAGAQLGSLGQTEDLQKQDLAAQNLQLTRQAGIDTTAAREGMAAQGGSQSGMARQTLGSKWAADNNTTDATRYGGSGQGTIQDQLHNAQGGLYRTGQNEAIANALARLGFNQDITKADITQHVNTTDLLQQIMKLGYINAPGNPSLYYT